jgi:hypothetical protein
LLTEAVRCAWAALQIFAGNSSSSQCLDVYGGYQPGTNTHKLDIFGCHANGDQPKGGSAREEFTVDSTLHAIKAIGWDVDMCITAMPQSQVKTGLSGKTNASVAPFYTKNDRFAKTGSGQT